MASSPCMWSNSKSTEHPAADAGPIPEHRARVQCHGIDSAKNGTHPGERPHEPGKPIENAPNRTDLLGFFRRKIRRTSPVEPSRYKRLSAARQRSVPHGPCQHTAWQHTVVEFKRMGSTSSWYISPAATAGRGRPNRYGHGNSLLVWPQPEL